MLLIRSSDDELSYGMNCRLLTEDDVLRAGLGEEFHLNVTETARRVFKGLKKARFLNRLRLTVNTMNQVRRHYKEYPAAVGGFEEWRLGTEGIFKEAKAKIIG
jgi:hypothetical protein